MGLSATTSVPMGAQAPVLSLKDHLNTSQGEQKGLGKVKILVKFFRCHYTRKRLSPHRQGPIGGADRGSRSLDPGPQDPGPGPNPHIVAAICKEIDPSPPHTHTPHPVKMGTPVCVGGGGQNRKIHWGITFCPKIMIQGVRRLIPCLGVCYANDPERGGIQPPRLLLI